MGSGVKYPTGPAVAPSSGFASVSPVGGLWAEAVNTIKNTPQAQANVARQMPNQSMGKSVGGSASPASNPAALNPEVQNDDQLLPYAKL